MKRNLILLPVLLVSVAVGFILVLGPGSAEEISVSSGAQSNYEDAAGSNYGGAAENNYSGSAHSSVPKDIFYTAPVKSVVFSHQEHAVKLGYKCDACHTQLFQMKAMSVEKQPDFTMSGLAKGKYCGSCHNDTGKPAFSSNSECARCHTGVKGLDRAEADKAQID